MRISAARLGREATTLDGVRLDGAYRLEFLPLIEGETAGGRRLSTYVVTESGGAKVSTNDLVPLGPLKDDLDQTLDVLATPVRIDLGRFAGQTIGLRWAIEPSSPDASARLSYVAGLRLQFADNPVALPDILMICSDTHRYDFATGEQGRALMPNLQRLSAQSLVYDWAFSASSWTLPSIASIFTGLPPRYHQTGRRTGQFAADVETSPSAAEFGVDWGEVPYENVVLTRFPRKLTTLGESLQRIGYTTAAVTANPMYYLSDLLVDGIDIPIGMNPTRGDRVNDIAASVLGVIPEDAPVFLVVHYMDVHQWIQWYYDRDHPDADAEQDSRENVLASYSEPVADADRFLGQLLDLWRTSRNFDDSLILFFADHGEQLLDPALGHGNTMEDELLHVPLVVKYPVDAGFASGTRVTTPVSLTDLTPTILELLGAPITLPPSGGRSLLRSAAEATAEPRAFFADFQLYDDELASVRRGDFKLVVNLSRQTSRTTRWRTGGPAGSDDTRQNELLAAALADYERLASAATQDLDTAPSDTQEAIEALKSLGYIQ